MEFSASTTNGTTERCFRDDDDTEDDALRAILLHNAGEEIEHASMILEWIRRNDPRFDKELREYLFKDGPITELENKAMGRK